MGDALAGISGRHIDILAARIAADESAVIDRIKNLAGPAMRFPADLWHQTSDPGFQALKADPGIVSLAGFVVRTADDEMVCISRSWLQADIVIGVERIPVEPIQHRPARDGE